MDEMKAGMMWGFRGIGKDATLVPSAVLVCRT